MRAVLIGVGEDDDAVVFQVGEREILLDAAAKRGNDGTELIVSQHLIKALLFDVERFAAKRQNGLEPPVAPLLGAAAGAVALYDEQLVLLRLPSGAAGKLAHQRRSLELRFLPGDLFRAPRGLAHLGRLDRFFNHRQRKFLMAQIFEIRRE